MGTSPSSQDMVVVGQFAGPHGVTGQFKVRSYTEDPASVAAYGPVTTKDGKVLTLTLKRETKPALFIATAPEISVREDCDAFKGALLLAPRAALPPPDDDEYYHADLVGLTAQTVDGAPAGKVKAVVNYGAGDILELFQVPERKGVVLVPFTKDAVPHIDIRAGQIIVELPDDGDDQPPAD